MFGYLCQETPTHCCSRTGVLSTAVQTSRSPGSLGDPSERKGRCHSSHLTPPGTSSSQGCAILPDPGVGWGVYTCRQKPLQLTVDAEEQWPTPLEEQRHGFSFLKHTLSSPHPLSSHVSTGWCCRNSYLLPWIYPSQKDASEA